MSTILWDQVLKGYKQTAQNEALDKSHPIYATCFEFLISR